MVLISAIFLQCFDQIIATCKFKLDIKFTNNTFIAFIFNTILATLHDLF